jgi:hypothetical protein
MPGSSVAYRVDHNEEALRFLNDRHASRQQVIAPAVDLILPQYPARRELIAKSHHLSNERIIQSLPTSPQKQVYGSNSIYGIDDCSNKATGNEYVLEKINKSKVLPKEVSFLSVLLIL